MRGSSFCTLLALLLAGCSDPTLATPRASSDDDEAGVSVAARKLPADELRAIRGLLRGGGRKSNFVRVTLRPGSTGDGSHDLQREMAALLNVASADEAA